MPKLSYVAVIPAWNMFIGIGAYLDDLDLKLKPPIAGIGVAMLMIAGKRGLGPLQNASGIPPRAAQVRGYAQRYP